MDRRMILAILRVGFAVLAVVAILVQMLDLADRGVLNPVNFFSYFTIQSNLIAVAALLWAAAAASRGQNPRRDFFRGAATTYMTVTFVVFALLLADTDVDTAIVWVDRVLHRVIPIVLMADWLIDPPAVRVDLRRAWWWLSYPLAWVVYTMIRGGSSARIPTRSLIRPTAAMASSWATAWRSLVGMLLFIYAIVWIGNAMAARRPPTA